MTISKFKLEDISKIERLIKLSDSHALIPDEYIPWETDVKESIYMPNHIISLQGHPLFDTLTSQEIKELGRYELAQVMRSYAWSEGMACMIFNRRLLKLDPTSIEYQYLVKELIEEFRHQDMFGRAIRLIGAEPVKSTWFHNILSKLHVKFLPKSYLFLSVVAIELVTDIYGDVLRKDENVFLPIRKVSELHHIEEGRHIYYTKLWLKHYLDNASFFKRTTYSLLVATSILFMRSMYVRVENFEKIGIENPKKYAKAAKRQLKKKFGAKMLGDLMKFVDDFNGFNLITKPFWKLILNAKFK